MNLVRIKINELTKIGDWSAYNVELLDEDKTIIIKRGKNLKSILEVGKEYMVSINQNFINYVEPFDGLENLDVPVTNVYNTAESKKEDNLDDVFSTLNRIKCKVEKKGSFNYVSWTDAWEQIIKLYPKSTFKVHEDSEGFPAFIKSGVGAFVKVSVIVNGIKHTEHYPVTDNSNKPHKLESYTYKDKYGNEHIVEALNSFHINTAIKRSMVKALAYFGLGLYVYKGEDLPNE